jgi:hypothetical protein
VAGQDLLSGDSPLTIDAAGKISSNRASTEVPISRIDFLKG